MPALRKILIVAWLLGLEDRSAGLLLAAVRPSSLAAVGMSLSAFSDGQVVVHDRPGLIASTTAPVEEHGIASHDGGFQRRACDGCTEHARVRNVQFDRAVG